MADISKITLPSGTTYDIKDTVARQMLSAGVTFIIAWDGTGTAVAANVPADVQAGTVTGTLEAANAVAGAFYLIKSSSLPNEQTFDLYDEYVVIKPSDDNTTWFWEKIGDTRLNLSDVVTNVTLNKQTGSAIGSNSTFTVTQPTISLATGATAGTGVISVATGISSASASGDTVTALTGLGSPSTTKVLGSSATLSNTQPTITLASNATTGTGRVEVATGVSASKTNVKATASGANTAWNSKDTKTVVTGYSNTSSDNFLKSVSPTSKKLATTSITGVSGSTTASKATAATSQTTATGAGTASTTNTDWLKGVSVSDETLIIGAATMKTQSTTQFTFSNVTVPTAASAITVATGKVTTSDANGDRVITEMNVSMTGSALTALGDPTTASVIGTDATFAVTQPTVALATGATAGTGVVSLATDASATTTYLGATASGGGASIDSKDEKTVVTGYSNTTSDSVLGADSTITVTPTTTNVKATASGANTAWNSKDPISVLTETSSLTVTKGNS